MGIDRKSEQATIVTLLTLTDHAFNRGTGLPLIEHDRLVVRDAMLVEDLCVDTHGVRAASWVDPE
ncbi:hypothetical protein CS8_051530 [Cupriavidus sp. 8B]